MSLLDHLCGYSSSRLWCAIGGGGKTSLLESLAQEAARRGMPGTLTTTTRMYLPPSRWQELTPGWRFWSCGLRDGKASGPTPLELQQQFGQNPQHWMLVEADGSRGLPLKVHAAHEPVLPPRPGLVLLLVGLSALETRVDESVHRWQGYFEADRLVDSQLVGEVVEGLARGAEGHPQVVVFNQAASPQQRELALSWAQSHPGRPAIWRDFGWWGQVSL